MDRISAYSIIFLIMGLIAYGLICVDVLFDFYPTLDIRIGLNAFWQGTCLFAFFSCLLIYMTFIFDRKELFNMERLFLYLTGVGIFIFLFNSLSTIFSWFEMKHPPTPVESVIYNLISFFLLVFHYANCLVLFKKLVMVGKNKWVIISWRTFILLLLIAPVFNYLDLVIPKSIVYAYLGLAAALGLFLSFRFKWVSLLNARSKLINIGLLLILNFISVQMITYIFREDTGHFQHFEAYRNVFLLMISGFVGVYGLFSMVALIFNLPLTAEMERKASEISSFQEISKIIQDKMNTKDILEVLLHACINNTEANGGWLLLNNGEDKKSDIVKSEELSIYDIRDMNKIITEHYIVSSLERQYKYIPNADNEEAFRGYDMPYKSLLIYSLQADEEEIGKLMLVKSYRSGFDEYKINLVKSYLEQSTIAIENANLLSERLEGERYKEELEVARRIQQDLLPQSFPESAKIDIAAYSKPAKEVGGDYYDFYRFDDQKFAVVIGDVSGKGTSAAFHMAELKGIFQALIDLKLSPADFMVHVNNAVSNCLDKGLFITFAYILVDLEEMKITYARAGHCPILYYDHEKQQAEYFDDDGIGLGIIRSDKFRNLVDIRERSVSPDSILVLYTDGITEARSENGEEEYDYDRLAQVLEKNASADSRVISDGIFDDLKAFTRSDNYLDDSTLIVMKFRVST